MGRRGLGLGLGQCCGLCVLHAHEQQEGAPLGRKVVCVCVVWGGAHPPVVRLVCPITIIWSLAQ